MMAITKYLSMDKIFILIENELKSAHFYDLRYDNGKYLSAESLVKN